MAKICWGETHQTRRNIFQHSVLNLVTRQTLHTIYNIHLIPLVLTFIKCWSAFLYLSNDRKYLENQIIEKELSKIYIFFNWKINNREYILPKNHQPSANPLLENHLCSPKVIYIFSVLFAELRKNNDYSGRRGMNSSVKNKIK